MKIKVKEIKNCGDYYTERIILQVIEDCNLENYLIYYGRCRDRNPKNSYRFPDRNLKKGDKISLHIKNGKDFIIEIDGVSTHVFYWNRDTCVNNLSEIFIMRHITHSTLEVS